MPGAGDRFILFHLAYPEISARYNAIGRFGRISEVASRLTGQLSGEGNSAAFREFAWRFVNIIARALVALGQRPDYQLISRHVVNIDALFIDYARIVLRRHNAAGRGKWWHNWRSALTTKTRRAICWDAILT